MDNMCKYSTLWQLLCSYTFHVNLWHSRRLTLKELTASLERLSTYGPRILCSLTFREDLLL